MNDYELYQYICSLGDDKKKIMLDNLGNMKLKALVIASLALDHDKELLLDKLDSLYGKAFVVSSFCSDELKLKCLSSFNKSTKALIIASFHTDELKRKYFSCVTSDKDKTTIIKSFISDENKLWGIDVIEKEENKIPLIATLKSVDNMALALSKIKDYAIKLDILNNIDEKMKMLLFLKVVGKFQADVLASIQNVNFKCSFLDILSKKDRMIVLITLPDQIKINYLSMDIDYLDKMALVYTLKDIELKNKWIAKCKQSIAFDLGIDQELKFGLELECEGVLNTYFCNLWTDKSSYLATMDATLMQGLEVKSPPIHNNFLDLEYLYYVFNVLNKAGFTVSNRCGGHIHFDKNYLKTKEEYIVLLEIWSYAEEIFYLISNEEGNIPREYVFYFTKPFLEGILNSLKEEKIYWDLQKSDEEFIQGLSQWQETKNNSLNFYHQNKKLNTMEFRVPNGSMSFVTWLQNIKLFGRLLMVSKALGGISLEEASEDEKTLWNLKEELKQDISVEDKLEILLELLFSEEEKEVYRGRYYANKRLLGENNSFKKLEFYGIDMSRILRK